jgi:hypothetical protein
MPPQQPYKRPSILHNLRGEPDQLLIIQWAGAIFLTIAIAWNATVDAYLGHELVLEPQGQELVFRPTRFKPIGPDTLLFLVGMAGGAGSLYNWRRAQDRKHEIEKIRTAPAGAGQPLSQSSGSYGVVARTQRTMVRPTPSDPIDTMPGDPDAHI